MKLRDRLVLFSAAQLIAFGLLFAISYVGLERAVFPMLHDHLRDKADTAGRALASQLDVALATDDRAMVAEIGERVARDPDFGALRVTDAAGKLVFSRGDAAGAGVRATDDIAFEGMPLGAVTVVFETTRIDRLLAGARVLALIALVLWVAASIHAVVFARALVAPIRAMMMFSRSVAAGDLDRELSVEATTELNELRDHLNAMTRDLAARERDRKLAAAHTESLQRELRAASRTAGMAEIATGVLHNVGNVLNSLNVSVSLVDDRLRESKVAALARAVGLYDQHPGGLAAFVATDAGARLPQYLSSLATRLVDDNARVRGELAAIIGHVDHIKTIVATQQSYAQVSGVREQLDARALVDDALRIAEASLAKYGVEVVRDYAEVPTLLSDRHKLLQIFVNLVSNARHALLDCERGKLRITAKIVPTSTGVAISIIDNGIGIPPAALGRVFEHGFTTKKTGHGFGLHTSAITAQQLGGAITAASDGVGAGATFTVELPLVCPEKDHALAA